MGETLDDPLTWKFSVEIVRFIQEKLRTAIRSTSWRSKLYERDPNYENTIRMADMAADDDQLSPRY